MSSPSVEAPNAQTFPKRNPRRRPRHETDSVSSLRASQPQRKRSKIDPDTFTGPEDETQLNGHAPNGQTSLDNSSSSRMEMDIPTRVKFHKRAWHEDRALVLTETKTYTAKAIPCLPDQLRALDQHNSRGYITPSSRLALAVTRDRAITWDRTSTAPSPATRTFILPHPSKENEPLSLGALVTSESPQETGLIVVSAASGKITYWESLEDADALSLLDKHRNGIEGSMGSLMSGETVEAIESAGYAGFLLILSTGRTAQVLLRDPQSRPAISVRFLKADGNPANTGLFSGLRHALGGGNWLRRVVAAKSQPSVARGQMDVVLANEDAKFQFWQLGWAGQATFDGEVDASSILAQELGLALQIPEGTATQIKLVDFAFARRRRSSAKPHHSNTDPSTSNMPLITLVAISNATSLSFALVDLRIVAMEASVKRVLHLSSYTSPPVLNRSWKPKLLLSDTLRTAFVIFERALAIVSTATLGPKAITKLSPDAEMPEPFADILYLREDEDVRFIGTNLGRSEDKAGSASLFAFIRSHGLIKLQVSEPTDELDAIARTRVSTKDRIEQAVFYGTRPNNPFSFRLQPSQYDAGEVARAARQVSSSILRSDIPGGVPENAILIHQLEVRAEHMQTLALYLKQHFPRLDRGTRWQLLENAERLAAAQSLWRACERLRSRWGKQDRLADWMLSILEQSSEAQTFEDKARQYFSGDLHNLSQAMYMIATGPSATADAETRSVDTPGMYRSMLMDASELIIRGFEAAYAFRQNSAQVYNLEDEPLRNGLLAQEACSSLPEFWTAEDGLAVAVSEFVNLSFEYINRDMPEDKEWQATASVLATHQARCIEIAHKLHRERLNFTAVSDNIELKKAANDAEMLQGLRNALDNLHAIGYVDEAFHIAETYADMPALVALCKAEYARSTIVVDKSEQERVRDRIDERMSSWRQNFGQLWADEFFGNLFEEHTYQQLLDQSTYSRAELTRFLRQKPSRAKLAWINEVVHEGDFVRAGIQLMDSLCLHDESREQADSKDIFAASMAKLCILTANSSSSDLAEGPRMQARAEQVLVLTTIRDQLLRHFHPSVSTSMDNLAAVGNVTEDFCSAPAHSALAMVFQEAVGAFLRGFPADFAPILDVLTTMKSGTRQSTSSEEPATSWKTASGPFLTALQVLLKAGLVKENESYQTLAAMTWRRLFIRDDWTAIANQGLTGDEERHAVLEQTILFKVLLLAHREGYFDGPMGIVIPSPGNLIGLGTRNEDHANRFSDDSLQQKLAEATRSEDEKLQHAIEECELDNWLATAKNSIRIIVADDKKRKISTEARIRRAIAEGVDTGEDPVEEEDGSGDVEMVEA